MCVRSVGVCLMFIRSSSSPDLVLETRLQLLQLVGNFGGQVGAHLLIKVLANGLHLRLPELAGNVKQLIKVDVLQAVEEESLALRDQTDGRFLFRKKMKLE